nr:ANTAR domain-containing protein [Amycolatopsis umgeniensis]
MQAVINHLNTALASQPVIEQAKGMIMLLRNWSADRAFAALRQVSQHTNAKLHDVAAVVVAAGTSAEPSDIDDETTRLVLAETRLSILGAGFGG